MKLDRMILRRILFWWALAAIARAAAPAGETFAVQGGAGKVTVELQSPPAAQMTARPPVSPLP